MLGVAADLELEMPVASDTAPLHGLVHEMLATGYYTLDTLANSLQELLRRGRIDRDRACRRHAAREDALRPE